MQIVVAQPPNIELIAKTFPDRPATGVLYAWGEITYNPDGIKIPDYLAAHERAHGMRQVGLFGIEQWWEKYIEDPEFRYCEEVIGHRAEFAVRLSGVKDRNLRARLLDLTARRLTAPLYAYGSKAPTFKQALQDLQR